MSKRLFSQVVSEEENSKAAIPLSKQQPDLVNGIPLSGEDYLLVVRQQAKKCAKTMVAPLPQVIKKVKLPSHFQFFNDDNEDEKNRPIENWRKGYIETFKSYQKCKQKAKSLKQHKEITSIEEAYSILYPKEDKVSVIPTLSQHTILNMLKYHIEWLNKYENKENQFARIFELLVYLDPVLISKNIAILRDLSRECIKLRKSLPTFIAPLNIIITIISDAYGQSDLI
ncbi:survival motor neuron interacting protein 1-domain-containing protein [Thamnidium elegans]|nr:survival motor neuron interacting protein 1-domain-containing protein [Thamnidium elegans]